MIQYIYNISLYYVHLIIDILVCVKIVLNLISISIVLSSTKVFLFVQKVWCYLSLKAILIFSILYNEQTSIKKMCLTYCILDVLHFLISFYFIFSVFNFKYF